MRAVAAALLVTVATVACSTDEAGDGITVIATTTVLGDVVATLVGDDATVEVLLPVGADPHDYRASARQVAAINGADLVVANGLGLEEGLNDTLEAARGDGVNVLFVGDSIAAWADDPHIWMDPLQMVVAAGVIGAELTKVDPTRAWTERADAYAQRLTDLDASISELLAAVPNRLLVSNHDSLRHFATRYGFEVVGTVIPASATLAAPGSAHLAELVATIDRLGVPAIFADAAESKALAEAVAADAMDISTREGFAVSVVELYIGSLGGPGSGAETLVDLLLLDASRIAEALR
jgi:zinc/manganese transport system substrate-binding protein